MLEFLKSVFKDPLAFLPSKDAVAKQLNGVEFTKLLIPFVALLSAGLSVDKVTEFITSNQSSFGAYGGLLAAVAALIVQARRLYNQGDKQGK